MIKPIVLREGLRALRHLCKRGNRHLVDNLPLDSIPGAAGLIARKVLSDAENLTSGIDAVVSGIARSVLNGRTDRPMRLGAVKEADDEAGAFAASFYFALKMVLPRLGVTDAFVSEQAARTAYARCTSDGTGDMADFAARLMLALLSNRTVRDIVVETAATPNVPDAAIFAVMLWLQADCVQEDAAPALDSAALIALVLDDAVVTAARSGNEAALANLFRRYVPHV